MKPASKGEKAERHRQGSQQDTEQANGKEGIDHISVARQQVHGRAQKIEKRRVLSLVLYDGGILGFVLPGNSVQSPAQLVPLLERQYPLGFVRCKGCRIEHGGQAGEGFFKLLGDFG